MKRRDNTLHRIIEGKKHAKVSYTEEEKEYIHTYNNKVKEQIEARLEGLNISEDGQEISYLGRKWEECGDTVHLVDVRECVSYDKYEAQYEEWDIMQGRYNIVAGSIEDRYYMTEGESTEERYLKSDTYKQQTKQILQDMLTDDKVWYSLSMRDRCKLAKFRGLDLDILLKDLKGYIDIKRDEIKEVEEGERIVKRQETAYECLHRENRRKYYTMLLSRVSKELSENYRHGRDLDIQSVVGSIEQREKALLYKEVLGGLDKQRVHKTYLINTRLRVERRGMVTYTEYSKERLNLLKEVIKALGSTENVVDNKIRKEYILI